MPRRKTQRISHRPSSIAQLIDIPLGGIKQWILIRGQNRNNPILLFLHGGPGMSLIGVSSQYFSELEKHFVVVNWDQRGSGLTYTSDEDENDLTVEQFVSDATELARHLIKRFRRKKIFLVGHSWGSAIGTLTVKRHPELFYAYLGAGQVADMAENEAIQYQNLLDLAQRENRPLLLKQLEAIGPPPYRDVEKSLAIRTDFTLKYMPNKRSEMNYRKAVTRALIHSTEYRLPDLIRYGTAHLKSVKILWEKLTRLNLFELAPSLEVPAFYILGRMDVVVLPELSRRYIDQLQAPHKELIWFETGHSMQYENPQLFQRTIIEKLLPYATEEPPLQNP